MIRILRNRRLLLIVMLLTSAVLVFAAASVSALSPDGEGYYHTGHGTRVKKVAFISVKVYAIDHYMKVLPPAKSKRAVIDMDTDKKIRFKMLRDVSAEKIRAAMKSGFNMNGYTNTANIDKFNSAFSAEMVDDSWTTITYKSATKTTSIRVQGGGKASVTGIDFMKATWSVWFGSIDQPKLGTAMISKF